MRRIGVTGSFAEGAMGFRGRSQGGHGGEPVMRRRTRTVQASVVAVVAVLACVLAILFAGVANSAPPSPTDPVALFEPHPTTGYTDVARASLGGTVSAISQCCHSAAATLIDGNPENGQWWSSDRSTAQSIILGLPETRMTHGFVYQGQGNGWWEQIKAFDVAVSSTTSDPGAFTVVTSGTTQWVATPQEFTFPAPVLARFVKLIPKSVWVDSACCYSANGLQVLSGNRGGRTVAFTNLSTNGATYEWDFGDGTTSTEVSPTHVYAATGTYVVTLTTSSGDGRTDTLSLEQVVAGPVASFSTDPAPPAGLPITFTDTSSEAAPGQIVKRSWAFGDGGT